jgi:hypothetical protein
LRVADGCAIYCVTIGCRVVDAKNNEIAAAELAIDRKVTIAKSLVRSSICNLARMNQT